MNPRSEEKVETIDRAVKVLLAGALLSLGLVPCATAGPVTTYTYTGPGFTSWTGTDSSSAETNLSGSFTVSSPLGDGLTDATITPTSFSFTDGYSTLTNLNTSGGGDEAVFSIWTNGSGQITAWSYTLIGGSPVVYMESSYISGTLDDVTYDPVAGVPPAADYTNEAQVAEESETTPVAWVPSSGATTPEPTSLLLLSTGLLVLGIMRLRRKQIA